MFHWRLNDCQFSQVPGTLLSILAILNNAVVWIISIRPPISNCSCSFPKLLGTVPSAPIATSITVILIFHSFLSSSARPKYLSLSFRFLFFFFGPLRRQNSLFLFIYLFIFLFFLLIITVSSLRNGIRGSVCIPKS